MYGRLTDSAEGPTPPLRCLQESCDDPDMLWGVSGGAMVTVFFCIGLVLGSAAWGRRHVPSPAALCQSREEDAGPRYCRRGPQGTSQVWHRDKGGYRGGWGLLEAMIDVAVVGIRCT